MLSSGEAALIFNSERYNSNDILAEKFINLAKEGNAELIVTLSPTTKNIIKQFPGRGKIEVLDIAGFVEKMSN